MSKGTVSSEGETDDFTMLNESFSNINQLKLFLAICNRNNGPQLSCQTNEEDKYDDFRPWVEYGIDKVAALTTKTESSAATTGINKSVSKTVPAVKQPVSKVRKKKAGPATTQSVVAEKVTTPPTTAAASKPVTTALVVTAKKTQSADLKGVTPAAAKNQATSTQVPAKKAEPAAKKGTTPPATAAAKKQGKTVEVPAKKGEPAAKKGTIQPATAAAKKQATTVQVPAKKAEPAAKKGTTPPATAAAKKQATTAPESTAMKTKPAAQTQPAAKKGAIPAALAATKKPATVAALIPQIKQESGRITDTMVMAPSFGLNTAYFPWEFTLLDEQVCWWGGTYFDDQINAYLVDASKDEEFIVKKLIGENVLLSCVWSIKKVKNDLLETMFLEKKHELCSKNWNIVQEKLLLHATAEANVDSIIKNNFDISRVKRSKFGLGISFSDDAAYADCHANPTIGKKRAFIITRVLISNCEKGKQNQAVPSFGFDTTTGQNEKVFVKFQENEMLPVFVAYYMKSKKKKKKKNNSASS